MATSKSVPEKEHLSPKVQEFAKKMEGKMRAYLRDVQKKSYLRGYEAGFERGRFVEKIERLLDEMTDPEENDLRKAIEKARTPAP